MVNFDGDFGIQFATHVANNHTMHELVNAAKAAEKNGFTQVWASDNLGYRNIFVVLSAIASEVPIDIGTAIMVPYYRNPVDLADTLVTLSELSNGSEICLGLGRGDFAQTANQAETPKPYRMMHELKECLQALLEGDEIRFGDYESLTSYFNLKPERNFQMEITPQCPIKFRIAAHGPIGVAVGGKYMDGLLISGYSMPLFSTGKMDKILKSCRNSAKEIDPDKRLSNTVEFNVSISSDFEKAIEYPKTHVGHYMKHYEILFTDEEIKQMGIDLKRFKEVNEAFDQGATVEEVADNLVTDAMVESCYAVGNVETCKDRILELIEEASKREFDQIIFKVGPNLEETTEILANDILNEI